MTYESQTLTIHSILDLIRFQLQPGKISCYHDSLTLVLGIKGVTISMCSKLCILNEFDSMLKPRQTYENVCYLNEINEIFRCHDITKPLVSCVLAKILGIRIEHNEGKMEGSFNVSRRFYVT